MAQRGDIGVPVPHLKNGSRDPCIQSAHVIVSSTITRQVTTLPWIGRPIIEDPDRQQFAGEIAEGNIAEASTYSLGPNCAWHRDLLNPVPPNDDSSWVMNVNHAFGDGSTLGALFYQRSSVCSSLRASSIQDPLIEYFYSSYNGFTEARRTFSRVSIPAYSNGNTRRRNEGSARLVVAYSRIGCRTLFPFLHWLR
jgi:hypothetical protein